MKKIKIVATIEARMNSTRLPGKVMKKFGKHPMLGVLIDRLIKSKKIDDIVVATSKSKKDNKIVSFLKKKDISFYRGSENNVNLRLIKAAQKYNAGLLVQLTADNPFVDHKIIDYMINFFLKNLGKYDYVTNCGFGDYSNSYVPLGFNAQLFLFKHLKANYKHCNKKDLREHPSLYFYREGKRKYKLKNLPINIPKTDLKIRLTVDTTSDLKLARLVFKKLGHGKNVYFGLKDVINFFKKNKSYLKINENIIQKKVNLK